MSGRLLSQINTDENRSLPGTHPMSDPATVQLLEELDEAWRRGERLGVEQFLARFPGMIPSESTLEKLVYREFLQREATGAKPDPAEYFTRFPALQSSLSRLFEVHRGLMAANGTSPEKADASDAPGETTVFGSIDPDIYRTTAPAGYEVHRDLQAPGADSVCVHSEAPQLAGYELLKKIAQGGMGVVFRARHLKLGRTVALKLIRSGELAGQDEILRFHAEAEAAAQLDHPGIVAVFEAGEVAGQHFLAMAFVDGQSLWQEVQAAPLPPKRAARLIQQVAEAVQYAHDRGIIHRDLKPQNILLTRDDQPKVTDFGLAKQQESNSNLTQTGQALGTPSYMPPEQARGNTREIGTWSDVYSLGATLYCLLTGRPPFQAATQLETMLQVVDQEPVSPKSLNRAVSVDLETICLKCLEKCPTKRYGSAAALADDLGRYLRGEPVQARAVGRLEQTVKWIARRPMTAAAYGLTALTTVLVLVGITISIFWRNAESARNDAEQAQSKAEAGRRLAEEARKREVQAKQNELAARQRTEVALAGEQKARAGEQAALQELKDTKAYDQYVLNVRLAPAAWDNGWVTSARQALQDCPPSLRQWEWKYYHRKMHPELMTLQNRASGLKAGLGAMNISSDGKLLATASHETVCIWDAVNGQEVKVFTHSQSEFRCLAFSPDGKYLAAGADRGPEAARVLWVWDCIQNKQAALINHPHGALSVAFSSDGTRLATGGRNGTLRLWNATDLSEIPGTRKHPNGVASLQFLPDGKTLISACWNGMIQFWDPVSGKLLGSVQANHPGRTENIISLHCTPDGRECVSVVRDGTVKWWNITAQREIASYKLQSPRAGERNIRDHITFSPNLQKLSRSHPTDPKVKVWDARTGKLLLELPGHKLPPATVTFSPDHQRFASGGYDGEVRVWDALSGSPLGTLMGHDQEVSQILFSHDGSRLFAGDRQGTIRVWDLTRTDEVEVAEAASERVVAISSDASVGAFVTADQGIRVRKLLTGEEIARWPGSPDQPVLQLAFRPHTYLLASTGADGTVRLWDAVRASNPSILSGHQGRINRFDFSPRGDKLATASDDRTIKVWDIDQQRELLTLKGHNQEVTNIAFGPDGARLASIGLDNIARLWDLTSGHELARCAEIYPDTLARRGECWIRFTPDGSRMIIQHIRALKIWHPAKGNSVVTLPTSSWLSGIDISSDGRWIASASEVDLRIWELSTNQEVARFKLSAGIDLKFSPDDSRLACSFVDRTVRLLDTRTWREIATLSGHRFPATQLRYNPLGTRLISIGIDGTVHNWIAEESLAEQEERVRDRPGIWRRGELRRAEETQNWKAAVFHLGWLLKDHPDDEALNVRHRQAVDKFKAQNITGRVPH